MTNRSALALLVAVLVAVNAFGLLALPAVASAAQPAPNNSSGNATEQGDSAVGEVGDRDLSLEELRNGGKVRQQDFPALRPISNTSALSLRHWPPGLLTEFGNIDDSKQVSPSTTVKRNKIQMLGTHPWDGETRSYDVVVVYWTQETQTVQDGNGTREQQVANVSAVDTQTVEMQPGMWQQSDINLRPHYGESTRVTMWVKSKPSARWTFEHSSIPISQQVNINSKTALLKWSILNVAGIAIVGLLVSYWLVKSAINRSKAGPMKGPGFWVLMSLLGGGAMLVFAFETSTTVYARAPQVLGIAIAAVAGVMLLEGWGSDVSHALFERPEVREVVSPNGAPDPVGSDSRGRSSTSTSTSSSSKPLADLFDEDVNDLEERADVQEDSDDPLADGGEPGLQTQNDAIYEEIKEKRVVESDNGIAIVEPGIMSFFARLWAKPAQLSESDLKTDVRVKGGKWRNKIYVDADADEVLDVKPPSWSLTLPILSGDAEEHGILERINFSFLAVGLFGGYLCWLAASWLTGGNQLVAAAIAVLPALQQSLKAVDGRADLVPAPIMQRSAKATAVSMSQDVQDARTFEEQEKMLTRMEMQPIERAHNLLRNRSEEEANVLGSRYEQYHGAAKEDTEEPADSATRNEEAPGDD